MTVPSAYQGQRVRNIFNENALWIGILRIKVLSCISSDVAAHFKFLFYSAFDLRFLHQRVTHREDGVESVDDALLFLNGRERDEEICHLRCAEPRFVAHLLIHHLVKDVRRLQAQVDPTDSRVKISEGGVVQTLTRRMGTGGNNTPLVAQPEPITMKIRCGKEGGGKGPLLQHDKSATLGCNNDQTLFQPEVKAYGVCSKSSHAMLSDNPKSGFYEAGTSRTLDQGGGNPSCNQGGICIVAPAPETFDVRFTSEGTKNTRGHCYPTEISRCLDTGEANPDSNHGGIAVVAFAQNQRDEVRDLEGKSGALQAQPGMKQQTYVLQGSMIGRTDKNGPQGDGINEDVSFTLNTVDHHAVAAPAGEHYSASKNSFFTQAVKEQANTLVASDWKEPPLVNDTPNDEPVYIVRRLTPVECARLQGFPDWWCDGLAIPNPTAEELTFWTEVWETWRKVTRPDGKPKTENQLRKWLADPYTDAAEYKLWGNGICLPIVYFVLSGITWAAGKE